MQAIVSIRFKPGVLDPEAQAITRALKSLGFSAVKDVRKVRAIELELETSDPARARAEVEAMCDQLLVNPVIEAYDVRLLED